MTCSSTLPLKRTVAALLALASLCATSVGAGQTAQSTYTVTPLELEGSVWFVAPGPNALWAPNPKSGSVSRIDPGTNKVTPIWVHPAWTAPKGPNGYSVISAAATENAVWVADEGSQQVVRIDPKTNSVTARISVEPNVPLHVAVGEGAVWVVSRRTGELIRIDPATNRVTSTQSLPSPNGLTVAHGSVWVTLTNDGAIARVDPKTNKVSTTIQLEKEKGPLPDCGHCVLSVTADTSAVWVLGSAGRIWRVDPKTNAVRVVVNAIETADLKNKKIERVYAQGIATGNGALWVGLGWGSQRLARVDPATGAVELVEFKGLADVPYGRAHVVFGFGSAWVSADQSNTLYRVRRAP